MDQSVCQVEAICALLKVRRIERGKDLVRAESVQAAEMAD